MIVRNERGSASIWAILVISGAFTVLLGLVVDGGRVMDARIAASRAAAQAARVGADSLSSASVRSGHDAISVEAAKARAQNYLHDAGMSGAVSVSGDTVTVTVTGASETQILGVIGIAVLPDKGVRVRSSHHRGGPAMTAIRRAGILLRGLSSAVILVVLAVGVPAMLLGTVGNPLPDEWTWTSPLTTGALLGLLACVAWVFWVQLVICVVVELIAEVRLVTGRSADWLARVPGTFGGQQALARSLVQAVVAIGLTTTATGTTTPWIGPADAATPAPAATPAVATQVSPTAAAPASAARRSTISVTVERGDTLWWIAKQHLGAGERWREIAELNRGREMTDGSTFDDARTILPGWDSSYRSVALRPVVTVEHGDTLWELRRGVVRRRLPSGHASTRPTPTKSRTQPGIFPGQRFVVPDQRAKEPSDGRACATASRTARHGGRPARPTPPARGGGEFRRRLRQMWPRQARRRPTPRRGRLGGVPEDSGFHVDGATITRALLGGGGFLAAGMLAVYVGRRRTQTRNRRSGRAMPSVAPPLRADDKVLRAIGNEAGQRVAFFDSALRELAQLIEGSGSASRTLRRLCIDQERLELHLAHPELAALTRGSPRLTDRCGPCRRPTPPAHRVESSPYPAMVTLGNDADGGTWLLDLESAGVTQIVGPSGRRGRPGRFVAAELALNPWSDAEIVSVAGIAARSSR